MDTEPVVLAVGGTLFTAVTGAVAYVLRQVQFQFDVHEKRIESLQTQSTATTAQVQRLEVAVARHEARSEDTVRRIEDLTTLVHAQREETRIQGLTLAAISTKLDQLLHQRGTE